MSSSILFEAPNFSSSIAVWGSDPTPEPKGTTSHSASPSASVASLQLEDAYEPTPTRFESATLLLQQSTDKMRTTFTRAVDQGRGVLNQPDSVASLESGNGYEPMPARLQRASLMLQRSTDATRTAFARAADRGRGALDHMLTKDTATMARNALLAAVGGAAAGAVAGYAQGRLDGFILAYPWFGNDGWLHDDTNATEPTQVVQSFYSDNVQLAGKGYMAAGAALGMVATLVPEKQRPLVAVTAAGIVGAVTMGALSGALGGCIGIGMGSVGTAIFPPENGFGANAETYRRTGVILGALLGAGAPISLGVVLYKQS